MKLLRIIPDGTKFRFVRFRKVSFPFSAILLAHHRHLVPHDRPQLRHRLQGRHAYRAAGEIRQGGCRGVAPHAWRGFVDGEVEAQEFGNGEGVSLRYGAQPGGEQAQSEAVRKAHAALDSAYEFRRVETVGPRVSGELVQNGTIGVLLAIVAVLDLSLVPLRAAIRHRRHHRHDARHRAHHGFLPDHPHRIQHDLDRGDSRRSSAIR